MSKPSMKDTRIEHDYTGAIVSVGSWSLGGAGMAAGPFLVRIEHGIEDYALVYFYGESPRWYKIQYTSSGRAFIRSYGRRLYFDECIRYQRG